jgi:hypothetical protein
MQRLFSKIPAIAVLMNALILMNPWMSSPAYGQSLGDIARQNREQQSAEDASGARPKVITNKDLPQDPDGEQGPRAALPAAGPAFSNADDDRSAEQRFAEHRFPEQRAAQQTKRQILAQENRMANLQARIDQLNGRIQSVCGTAQYERPCNRYQARQLQRLAQMQIQLDEQKRKLEQMQEAARHSGMRSAVYEP